MAEAERGGKAVPKVNRWPRNEVALATVKFLRLAKGSDLTHARRQINRVNQLAKSY